MEPSGPVQAYNGIAFFTKQKWSPDTIGTLVTRLRAGQQRNRASIPSKAKIFFSFSKASRLCPGLTKPPVQKVAVTISPGLNRPGP